MIAFTDPIAERVEELQDFLQVPRTGHACRVGVPDEAVLRSARRADRPPPAGPPAPLEVEDASFLVNAIAVTIIGGFERSDGDDLVWSARDGIDHATGMGVAQLGVPASDALALLRAHAFAHDQALTQVADAVVSPQA